LTNRSIYKITYSGCQKNVAVPQRFFLQPLMPQFRYSEHYYGKRYKINLSPIARWGHYACIEYMSTCFLITFLKK